MNNTYYPEVDPTWFLPLRVIFTALQGDPLWLERPECPYDEETCSAIREVWLQQRGERTERATRTAKPLGDSEDRWTQLEEELTTLYDELRNFQSGVSIDDAKEHMAVFRTATSLLDKLVGLSERANNVKSVSEFRARVLGVFDEILTPDQRSTAMEKLAQ